MRGASCFFILGLSAAMAGCVTVKTGGGDSHAGETGTGQACTGVIPAGADVVTGEQTYNGTGVAAWACQGSTVTVNAAGLELFLESGSVATINATGAVVYAKSGSTVVVNADGAQVYRESGVDLTTNGTNIQTTSCSSMTFDSSAVTGGSC